MYCLNNRTIIVTPFIGSQIPGEKEEEKIQYHWGAPG